MEFKDRSNEFPSKFRRKLFKKPPTHIVLHGTGVSSLETGDGELDYLLDPNRDTVTGYHYYIARDGFITRLINVSNIAYHAGESWWDKMMVKERQGLVPQEILWQGGNELSDFNNFSIGIGIENTNRPNDPITIEQINAVIDLLKTLHPDIPKENIMTHYMISAPRKTDPDNITDQQLDIIRRKKYIYSTLVEELDSKKTTIREPFIISDFGDKLHVRFLPDEVYYKKP